MPTRLKSFVVPKPLAVVRTTVGKLSASQRKALDVCPLHLDPGKFADLPDNHKVRIETYATADVRRLVVRRWEWSADLHDVSEPKDKRRIEKIMAAIKSEGQWPYISFWVRTMKELADITVQGDMAAYEENQGDYEVSVPNHGDGWHRIVAAIALGLPTIDFLFI